MLLHTLVLFTLLTAPASPPPPTPKVLLVGIDGARWDAIRAARTPAIDALLADGCWTDRSHTGEVTVSGPGWSSILCGVWMDKHGVRDNSFRGANYDDSPHFFVRLKQARPDTFTASIVDWREIDDYITPEGCADFRFFHDYEDDGDARCVEAAERLFAHHDPDAVFFYFADADVAGHAHGFHPAVPAYLAEIEQIDAQIARILAAIRARPSYLDEDWLVILTTDHSGTLDGAHGRNEDAHRRMWMIVSGRAAARGRIRDTVNQTDAVATAFAHLGVPIDPAWRLDARPVGLARTADDLLARNLIHNGDAEQSTPATDQATNRGIAGWTDLAGMTVIAYGAPDGFPTADSPGPPDRGLNFFAGGPDADASIHQTIDLAPLADRIDDARVAFTASAWLGGFADQRDMAEVIIDFLDDRDAPLLTTTLGPVTLEQRREAFGDEPTGFLERHAAGRVPRGARTARVTLNACRGQGANDGYADNLSLTLRADP